MLKLEDIPVALRSLEPERPLRWLPIGQSNLLQGQAGTLELADHRILLVVVEKCSVKPVVHCSRQAYAQPELQLDSWSWLRRDWQVDWGSFLRDLGPVRPPFARPVNAANQNLGAPALEVLSVAIRERMSGWDLTELHLDPRVGYSDDFYPDWETLRLWWPQLECWADSGASGRVPAEQLSVPWPVRLDSCSLDMLDFYEMYPQAHGKLSASAVRFSSDGQQALLGLRHSLGFKVPRLGPSWPWRLPRPRAPLPEPFHDVVHLQFRGGQWVVSGWLPKHVLAPPQLLVASEKARIQTELGELAEVVGVEVNAHTATRVELRTSRGPVLVLLSRAVVECLSLEADSAAAVYREATLWVFGQTITGEAIRQALG